jgi:formylglycine-generating enzyme required for sulfatase activity
VTQVFISYSRRDGDFVRKLNNALQRLGRETWVDWQNIPRGERWLNQIYLGIEHANAIVCVISRHSLMSEICNEEFHYAFSRNKRVLPLILEAIEDGVFNTVAGRWLNAPWEQQARNNWEAIQALNWIFFIEDHSFEAELAALIDAIDTDREYVDAHTRYQVLALEWDRQGQSPSLLLHGEAIAVAEGWLESGTSKEPQPHRIHHEYITASRTAESERQARAAAQERRTRRFRQAAIFLLFTVVLAAAATFIAVRSAQLAEARREEADQFRQVVEEEATVFALERQEAERLLLRFGSVPTSLANLSDEAIIATATAVSAPTDLPEQVTVNNGTEMVYVTAGCFLMGSVVDGATPVHQTCIEEPYWIDRYEVTRAQYHDCPDCEPIEPNSYSSKETQPINAVSWWDAQIYCSWRGARLPSEAEWEYAARGPSSLAFPWGDQFNPDHAIYIENANNETGEVGARPAASASWIGAYDMSGNVAEWVRTAYAVVDPEERTRYVSFFTYPYDASDGREDIDQVNVLRVVRGGSFNSEESIIRPANRQWLDPEATGNPLIGFRCARSDAEDSAPTAVG